MKHKRIKVLKGVYFQEDFEKLIRQLNGRAILVVAIVNSTCEDCMKIMKAIQTLEGGYIERVPQMVMVYGINYMDFDTNKDKTTQIEKAKEEREKQKKARAQGGRARRAAGAQKVEIPGDSRNFIWCGLPEGHGYAVFLNEKDKLTYDGAFDHDEFMTNILDNVRRFQSSVKTIAGLPAKRRFIEKKRTGIIIETNSGTNQDKVLEIEERIKNFGKEINVPIYFCKGVVETIELVQKGKVVMKKNKLNIDKFLKKVT